MTKSWALALGLACLPSLATEVRVIEPANRIYSGRLHFIESNGRLESGCVRLGEIVFRNAPFSADTIERMQQRAQSMGADTLVIKDTTIGPISRNYLIRMGAYKCSSAPASD